MEQQEPTRTSDDLDELRLFALGRIPRCTDCARFRVLRDVCARGRTFFGSLPSAPAGCSHQVCAPIVDRVKRSAPRAGKAEFRAWACNC